MRRVFALVVLTVLLSGATGCRIAECWREAWCSHCPQRQQAVMVSEPYVMSDSCSPCSSPCSSCTSAPAMAPIARP
jgi:hypothetical protein